MQAAKEANQANYVPTRTHLIVDRGGDDPAEGGRLEPSSAAAMVAENLRGYARDVPRGRR